MRLSLALLVTLAIGCHPAKGPELRVLGARDASDSHVFVQVTNPANHPMKLTRLDYTFASSKGTLVTSGKVPIEREVPAGAVVVVEVPYERDPNDATGTLTLRGKVTAELDSLVRTFSLKADIQPQ